MNLKRFFAVLLTLVLLTSFYACSGGSSLSLECEKCGTEYKLGMRYCPSCGNSLVASKPVCSKGHENETGAKFCAECVEALNSGNDDNGNNATNNSNGATNSGNNDSQNDGSQEQLEIKNWLLQEQRYETTGRTFKYFYDANGYLVGQEVWDDTDGLFSYYTYTNDGKGNCIEEYSSLSAYFGAKDTITITNTYDTQGRLTKALRDSGSYDQYYYEGDELVKVSHVDSNGEEYYDLYENGRMTLSYRSDGTTNYTETTIEFYYDDSGRCTGTNNESFEVDEYGNIVADAGGCTYKYITEEDYRSQNLHNNKYANGQNSNSSGSSGGSSSSGSSNGVKCQWCRGGRYTCKGCDGEGMVLSHYYNGKPMHKLCAVCHGECTVVCSYCGGDGIFGN